MSKKDALNEMKGMTKKADVQNEHLENISISLTNIADCLAQLLDFISVVNFDELEAREQEMRTEAEKRL